MLTTVLFDMGGTLEDIWYNEDTQRATCRRLLEVLRANGLEPGCPDDVFWKRITDGVKAYKQWSEGNMLEKKPEEIWPDWYLRDFAFDREKLLPITEELANLWEVTFYHRELRDGAAEMLQALKSRGYHLGVISNNASLYNVFRVLEDYGIRGFMEAVTVSASPVIANPIRRSSGSPCGKCRQSRKCASMWATRSPGTSSAPSRWALPRPCRSAPSCRSRRMCTWPRMRHSRTRLSEH